MNFILSFLPNTPPCFAMSLRIPPSDQSISPSPHRQMSQLRPQHASSPCSSSASPSPCASPLKQQRGKPSRFGAIPKDFCNQKLVNTSRKLLPNAPVDDKNVFAYNRYHNRFPHDTSMDTNSDHTPDSIYSSSISSSPSSSQIAFNKNCRPLSTSFTSKDPTFPKKHATSSLQSDIIPCNSFSSVDNSSKNSDNGSHPRGLRRSVGLLNLEEASHGSSFARKSSYRPRKSYAKPSPASVSSDFSKIDLSRNFEPATQQEFKLSSTTPTLPQKRPLSFGSMFGESSSQGVSASKKGWNFSGDSTKPSFKLNTKPGWQFSQQSRPTDLTPSPFYTQPYFSQPEFLSGPFQSSDTFPRSSSLLSRPEPTQKIRKMNPQEKTSPLPSSSNLLPPKPPVFSNFNSSLSTNPSHTFAFSYPSSSRGEKSKPQQSVSPVNSFNFSRTQSSASSFPAKPSLGTNKPANNSNLSLDSGTAMQSFTPEFSTPENLKFVKPLQTAFMSTGLISKRNRKKPFGDSQMAPPDTPCKKPLFPSITSQYSPGSRSVSGKTSHPSSSGTFFQFGVQNQPNNAPGRTTYTRQHAMNFGGFNDSLFSEPSTAKKSDTGSHGSTTPKHSTKPMSIPTKATKPVPDASTIVRSPFFSSIPNSNNSSSTSINRFSSTPLSQSSRFYDGSPSDLSSPRTPDISFHSDVPQLMLSLSKDNVLQYDDNNEMQDANIETPRTPAKALKSHHEIAIPSTMMGMEKMGQDNVTDIVLRERYSDVQLIGTGEFSIVYAASEKATSSGFEPARFAIKRTKTPFVGPKARSRRNEEVEILRNLTFSNKSSNEDDHEYIVNLIDAWELRGHLYIVTEYCENGNLDTFLSERGNISRLDEWRVWKILVELTLVCFQHYFVGSNFTNFCLLFSIRV